MFSPLFRVGVVFPQTEIEPDAILIRDFAQAIEGLGFNHIAAADHVVDAGTASRPEWRGPYSDKDSFHEPVTLFSYLAGVTSTLEFIPAVIVLPQRQTVLFAKQASNLDIFCKGRLRVGVGIGWNDVEYESLGVEFKERGPRLDEQIRVLRRLWSEATISESSRFHRIDNAGLNPLPLQRPIPIWVGGVSEAAMSRAARLGDGWLPSIEASGAEQMTNDFREMVLAEQRHPRNVGFENMIMVGAHMGRTPRPAAEAAAEVELWKRLGADGVCFHTKLAGARRADQHLSLLREIAEALELSPPGNQLQT